MVEISMVTSGIVINESVTYYPEHQRDLKYFISIETLGTFRSGSSTGYIWGVVMRRQETFVIKLDYLKTE